MNGSKENAAHGASESPQGKETVFNLATARNMLTLVQRIADDVYGNQRRLAQLLPEQERLDRQKRDLSWPERSRRYQVQEEVANADRELQLALAELAALGVVLVDADEVRVGFPTFVNNRRALFSWRRGEEGIAHWHFPEESARREIPPGWAKVANLKLIGKA